MELFKALYKKVPSELLHTGLSAHSLARHLTKDIDAFHLNLIEFDYLKLAKFTTVAEMDETLTDLDKLLSETPIAADSPSALLISSSLHSAMKSNTEIFKTKYSNVYKLLDQGSKITALAAVLEGKKSAKHNQTSDAAVNGNVTIKLDHHERTILPQKGQRNILISSALPYVNNVPHLGNIIGCVLSADVYARYCRLRGYNTLYVCGTDEYGTATETKALEEKVSCQELCDKYHALHKQTYEWFGIDFDIFGRTTTEKQTEIAQDIYKKLNKNGHVFEEIVTQLYCEKHESFLADRFVEGTCPLCGYEDARGDQCDKCGKLLNAIELVKPHCKLDGATPVPRDSKHLFLNLTEQQPELEKWFNKASKEGQWSSNSEHITSSWLKEGLKPRCITRDLKWGTAVPREGFEKKVFYVWFDAPIGYLSITANYTQDWEKWWKNPDDVKLYQFMGKDNVPFHTVIFPSTLMGTKENWTLLHHLSTTEYLQYESGKFSKSRGVGVFGNNVVDSGIPVEVWRYYLLSMRPETSDSQFTWQGFQAANNNELLANLGNLVNRLAKFVNSKYDGIIPDYTHGDAEDALVKDVNVLLKSYNENLEGVKIRQGLRTIMEISTRGNVYLQENKIDNALFSEQRERCDSVVATAANLCYLISALVYPYMPTTSEGILRVLNLPLRKITDEWSGKDIIGGHKIGAAEYLFKRIEDKKMDECRRLYSGQNTAAVEEPAKKSRKPAKKSEPVPPAVLTPEMKALQDRISEQGLVVRELKEKKATATEIKAAVDVLLALKKDFNASISG